VGGAAAAATLEPVRAPLAVAAAIAATCFLTVLLGAAPASAHATLTGTSPATDEVLAAPPERVELRFDEPVETVEDAVRVFGPGGQRVDTGAVDATDGGATLRAGVEGDAEGTYTVAWRVTSEDSHTLSGSFVYHVGTRTGAVDVSGDGGDTTTALVGGAGRWLGFAGSLAAVGAGAVALLLTPRRRPAVLVPDAGAIGTRAHDPAAVTRPEAAGSHGTGALDRLRALALVAAVAGALGAAVALVATVAESAGRGVYDAIALVGDVAPDTRTGRLALARIGLALVAAACAARAPLWRRSPLPVMAASGAALVTVTLAGHAWTAPDRWLAVAADVAHLGAVAVWTGGLLALLVALPALAGGAERTRLATRFSAVALAAVAVVAVSGAVSGWQQVRTLDALGSTAYGRLLLAKVAGFAVLVVLGWLNRSRLVPLVERTVAPLTRSLRVEVAVAAVVLGLTAALIHQAPARATVSEPYQATVTAEDVTLDLTVDPATAGPNDLHLYFLAANGAPVAVDAVQVTASTTGVPARRLPAAPVSTNHVAVAGASLPSAGTWTVEVTAVRAGVPLVFRSEVPIR
jgi:copper transport protein